MAGVGRLHEHLPWHKTFDEHGLERVKADEVLRKRFEIVAHYRIAGGIRFQSVLVETSFCDPPSRREVAGRRHGQASTANNYQPSCMH